MLEDLWLYIIIGLIAAFLSGLLIWYIRGKQSQSPRMNVPKELISKLEHLEQKTEALINQQSIIQNKLVEQEKKLKKAISHCQIIRFNPFADQGGNQSFSAAWLNDDGDGLVISGLHSRDKVHVYAKPIIKRDSKHELSAEEKAVIGSSNKKV